jgi:DNA-binding transcriptional ArsR family regulator
MTSNGHPRPLVVGEEPAPLTPAPSRAKARPKGKPAGERFKTLNGFVDFTLADLSRAEIAVWLILYRDTRDGTARTGYDDLARRAGLNRRNVGRALRRLEERRLVQVVYRGGFHRGLSRYRVRALGT